ncbi:MAG: hypothetical protein ABDI07_11650, partial [Candidatus Kryptonium sp.]
VVLFCNPESGWFAPCLTASLELIGNAQLRLKASLLSPSKQRWGGGHYAGALLTKDFILHIFILGG